MIRIERWADDMITRREEEEAQIRRMSNSAWNRRRNGDHRRFLKKDVRFRGILSTIWRLQDGPERREAIRKFREDQYAAEYADPMLQVKVDTLGIRDVVLREYEVLEDEERRETGREFQVIHPHAPHGSSGGSGFPLRDHLCVFIE
jgi:hypothetical protein